MKMSLTSRKQYIEVFHECHKDYIIFQSLHHEQIIKYKNKSQHSGKVQKMDECSTRTNVSDYMEKLDPPTRKRYKEKSKVIGGIDPYCIEGDDANSTEGTHPDITYPDMVNYLVFSHRPYTTEVMKSYKSLEAYNQVLESWVTKVKVYWHTDKVTVKEGQVNKMSLNLPSLRFFIAIFLN